MKTILFVCLSFVASAQTWTQVCNGNASGAGSCAPSSTMPNARGFNYSLPYDTHNHESLYFGATTSDTLIYSWAIWGYNSSSHAFTKRVDNNPTTSGSGACPQQGSPFNTYNPTIGHPQGYWAFDSSHNKAYATNQLCQNLFNGNTDVYDATTQAMTTVVAHAPWGTGDGTFNATAVNWGNFACNNSGLCVYINAYSSPLMAEFNGTTYTNINSLISGTNPTLRTAGGWISDGTNFWYYGGCGSASPGNGTGTNACSGTNYTVLFKYTAGTRVWTQISPVGGTTPPSANSAFPFIAWDSSRSRIILYAGTNDIWQYVVSTNTWSQVSASGTFPTYDAALQNDPDFNQASYDSATDTFVLMYGKTQGNSPAVYELAFGGGVCSITNGGLPDAVAHSAYSQTLTQANCSASSWTVTSGSLATTTGGLPTALTLNASTGVISGTPLYAGTISATISFSTASKAFAFNVDAPSGPVISVNLNIQEALYAGVSGVARTNEPFSQGVPIADSAGVNTTNALGLSGAVAGSCQFRTLGVWPSGNLKWVQVSGLLSSLSAGSTSSAITLTNGSGGFGNCAPGMATDNGTTITVATGAATFTIRKANFDVLDAVTVGSSNILISTGASFGTRGLVVTGPSPVAAYPGNVTCTPESGGSACSTLYWSDQDAASTCSIEFDGPTLTDIACRGTLYDSASHPYMQHTTRLYFYSGETYAKVDVVLRNADYNTSVDIGGNTFDTALKGFKSFEMRLGLNTSIFTGTLNWTMANHTATPTSGTISSGNVFLYQGQSTWMNAVSGSTGACAAATCANLLTTDTGYAINLNGVNQQTGTSAQCPQGWADISTSGGVGVEIGMYQLCAYWPSGLMFDQNGARAVIGLFDSHNSKNVYYSWPSWDIHTVFLNFHSSAPASLANNHLKLQHYLLTRPAISYVDNTKVFPYPHPSQLQEDTYYQGLYPLNPSVGSITNYCFSGITPCTPDKAPGNTSPSLACAIYYSWDWPDSGPNNQKEFRWGDVQKFLQQGQTCRFLDASHWYRFFIERGVVHWDGASSTDSTVNSNQWTTRPHAGAVGAELDKVGTPTSVRANAALGDLCGGGPCWLGNGFARDWSHVWWDGALDYYLLTGDETIREGIIPLKSWYLNTDTYQSGCCIADAATYTRSIGEYIGTTARFSQFLASVNPADTDATTILANGVTAFTNLVKPDICVRDGMSNTWPAGCTPPAINTNGANNPSGVSRVRGVPIQNAMLSNAWCNQSATYTLGLRIQIYFMPAILIEALDYLRSAKGPSWSDYEFAGDLQYGISEWAIAEIFGDDGSTSWCPGCGVNSPNTARFYNGFKYGDVLDLANVCPSNTAGAEQLFQLPGPPGTNNFWDVEYGILGPAVLGQNTMPYFWAIYNTTGSTAWARQLKIQNQIVGLGQSNWPADFGQYQEQNIISILNNPTNLRLQNIPFSLTNNGGGSYTLTFTAGAGSLNLRIKWSTLTIKDISIDDPRTGLLGFDNLVSFNFTSSPATFIPWFSANTTVEPAVTPGIQQSFTITGTGSNALQRANFSVKAMAPVVGNAGAVISGGLISGGPIR